MFEILYVYSWERVAYTFVLIMSLDFGFNVSRPPRNWKNVPSFFIIWEFVYDWYDSLLELTKNSWVKLSNPEVNIFSWHEYSYFLFFFSDTFCQVICTFYLNWQIYWYKAVQNTFLLSHYILKVKFIMSFYICDFSKFEFFFLFKN